jgi:hypothetical protein
MPQKITISRNLQEIIKEVSGIDEGTLNEKISSINEKQCTAVEFYLRAMAQRLDVP